MAPSGPLRNILDRTVLLSLGGLATLFFIMVCSSTDNKPSTVLKMPSTAQDSLRSGHGRTIGDELYNSRSNAITHAVAEVSPAVVGINVTQVQHYYERNPFADDPFFRNFFPDKGVEKQVKVKSLGSGFIISAEGYILTNQHVVEDATEIVVTRVGGKQYVAKRIGQDYTSDIAVLKIEGENFPYVRLGDSDDVIIGEWAIALGNPFGLFDLASRPTVTVGVISGKDQDFGRLSNDRIFADMLQTDAAINGGNSGGPLVNANGEVIGINTWIISGSDTKSANIGLGFAQPVNRVKRILNDLINYGRVNRSFWTGIHYDQMNPSISRTLGLASSRGVIITDIDRNSPAQKVGLEVGDVIIEINSKEVNAFDDIRSIIDNLDLKEGDLLKLRVFRNANFRNVDLRLEAHPKTVQRSRL
jgi:serine protease Do